MDAPIHLTQNQIGILSEFYALPNTQVVVDSKTRNHIWEDYKSARSISPELFKEVCPAIFFELTKALTSGNQVQSAVFSECAYAQTLANMLDLPVFSVFDPAAATWDAKVSEDLRLAGIKPRYVYESLDGRRALVQAGGFGGVDSFLLAFDGTQSIALEFKQPRAKSSEPDLPAYGEDGLFVVSDKFNEENPQFKLMVEEQLSKELNFFRVAGSNVHDFSVENVAKAVSENYSADKFADVVCVEDSDGFLTILPSNHLHQWAEIRGEIRPAGRNAYKVWTPEALRSSILNLGGVIEGNDVAIPIDQMTTASKRGGDATVSRYKISPLFFVREQYVVVRSEMGMFKLDKVEQLKPTISAHMYFDDLRVDEVRATYREWTK